MLQEKTTIELGQNIFLDVIPGNEYVNIRAGKMSEKIRFVDLYGAVFAMADADQQERLLPVRKTEMTTFTKVHAVKLKKALPAGAIMKVRCHTNIPTTVVEGLKGLVEKQKSQFALP